MLGGRNRGWADVLAQHAAPLQGRRRIDRAKLGCSSAAPLQGPFARAPNGGLNVGRGYADVIEAGRMCWRSMLRRYKGDAGSIAPSWGPALLHPHKGRPPKRQTGAATVGAAHPAALESH